jgi:hypothetical protein
MQEGSAQRASRAAAGFMGEEAHTVVAHTAAEVTGNGIVHEDSNFRHGERNHALCKYQVRKTTGTRVRRDCCVRDIRAAPCGLHSSVSCLATGREAFLFR